MTNWVCDDFNKIFKKENGARASIDEAIFISELTDIKTNSSNKIIYYNAMYRLKRWYPKRIIYLLVLLEYKYVLYKKKAPKNIKKLVKHFAFYTYLSALKAYTKNTDVNSVKQ